jgi:hypothetical protein
MKKIAGREIETHWTDWAVQYPDGEILIVEDEETARDIVRCAAMVKVKYRIKTCEHFVTEWEDPA